MVVDIKIVKYKGEKVEVEKIDADALIKVKDMPLTSSITDILKFVYPEQEAVKEWILKAKDALSKSPIKEVK